MPSRCSVWWKPLSVVRPRAHHQSSGGLAGGQAHTKLAGGGKDSGTHAGWTVGAGAEMALTPNWSVKAEYLYLSFAERSFTVTGTDNGLNNNLLRFGVNYRF